ncbi:3-hydroxyisobutyrate dehydrogenase [Saccharopolyspora antimicrobica]|uniref:3-hydroxyisobutyrate dehydrogenase n=1 Tax=Saccharopolyspora antimicrobica TaxID=455193 RepID=A0A1I4VLK6_9PSEU|nr:FAD-dependent oxidoreductase [Saccharopolyspora antimicrobica]RKT87311.1 3-hydroxyisobutyrate dehydrogenase-like beta-hydroxyacid dehydrogenase [Saccharopolyspora antimicrobica]SFN02152.1 3-hydroxyisobutyrate dehydrogenase [Saccharopolyspora antimicrobica]
MADSSDGTESRDVAVLGCGLMGAALARALARSGHSVVVWNRTPERAEALAGERIRPVRSVGEAVRASRLVLACTSTYESALSALDPVADWHGVALVNLASGAPEEVEQFERWAAERGAEYLDGSIACYPQDIGSPHAMIVYSGSPAAWSKHEQTLMSLGGASGHVSARVADASLLNVGIVGAFYVAALSAYVEAATYVLGRGVSAGALRELSQVAIESLRRAAEESAAAIESGNHETDQATIETYAEGARAGLAVMRSSGQQARLLTAAVENLTAAEAAGLGKLGFSAQAEVLGVAAEGA